MVNPTGKEGRFRGADWVEESNNMFAKVRNYPSASRYIAQIPM
jgi:hypothetical protein